LAEAVTLLQQAVDADPQQTGAWTQLGVIRFLRQDLGSAADALERALALDPAEPAARYHLALVELARGDRPAARGHFEAIVAADPAHVAAWIDLGVLDLADNQPESALERIDRALALEPTAQRARFYRAACQLRLGTQDAALAALRALESEDGDKYPGRAREWLRDLNAMEARP
jgi:tetratricopeptide (TPR) repeat protein